MRVSIIIPTVNDPHLDKTIDNLRANAGGEIEIIVEEGKGMRQAINDGVKRATGEYILKCDAHCTFDTNYDLKLLEGIQDDWVVSPRRYKLDVDNWKLFDDHPIDYMKIDVQIDKLHGAEDKRRTRERKDIMVDENMIFQGSCWVMSRKWWDRTIKELQIEGYGTFTQEPQEICLKTWLGGGKVMLNKNTWYSHRDRRFRRTVRVPGDEVRAGNEYSRDYWLSNKWPERIHDYEWLVERFR